MKLLATAEHLEALGLSLQVPRSACTQLLNPLQVTQLMHSDETGLLAGIAPWQSQLSMGKAGILCPQLSLQHSNSWAATASTDLCCCFISHFNLLLSGCAQAFAGDCAEAQPLFAVPQSLPGAVPRYCTRVPEILHTSAWLR